MTSAVRDSPRRPHIAIFLQDLSGGGAERVMANLAVGLAQKGSRVDLVLVRAEGPFLASVAPHVRIVDLATKRVASSILSLARYIDREKPDVLLSGLVHVNTAAILASRLCRRRVPVIVTDHNDVVLDRSNTPELPVRVAYALMPLTYRLADAIVGVSTGVAESVARAARLAPSRVGVEFNPVVSPSLASRALEQTGHAWLDEPGPPVVLAIGRLMIQKDFGTLIRAVARLRESSPVRLVILGEGGQRQYLENLAHQLGIADSVALPGFAANPYAWISRARIFAQSSRWEGLPTVLIEALALGKPIVATDCPHGPAEILANGRYGQLVPPSDPEAMAQALSLMLNSTTDPGPLRRRADDFTIGSVSERYLSLIDRVLATFHRF